MNYFILCDVESFKFSTIFALFRHQRNKTFAYSTRKKCSTVQLQQTQILTNSSYNVGNNSHYICGEHAPLRAEHSNSYKITVTSGRFLCSPQNTDFTRASRLSQFLQFKDFAWRGKPNENLGSGSPG